MLYRVKSRLDADGTVGQWDKSSGLLARIRGAWLVLLGRADAVVWPA